MLFDTSISMAESAPLRLVITGDLHGAVKDCICPHGQPGGLARRKTIFDDIRRETPDALFIACGSLTDDQNGNELDLLLYGLLFDLHYNLICCYMDDWERLSPFIWAEFDPPLEQLPFLNCNIASHRPIEKLTQEMIVGRDSSLMVVAYTNLANYAEKDSIFLDLEYQLLNWQETVEKYSAIVKDFKGLSALICNWDYKDPDMPTVPPGLMTELPDLDLIIIGGSGFIDPLVKSGTGLLVVYPGVYGEYVLVLDIWSENGRDVSRFEWEAIPTESVAPDSTFENIIEKSIKISK